MGVCPYQNFNKKDPNQISICEYTKDWCTLCVFGNAKTYNEAEEASKINSKQERKNNND